VAKNNTSLSGIYASAILTALYWVWESQASGNIRIDLLLIYPVLSIAYVLFLWPRFRYWSILVAMGLMALNFVYFVNSYSLFDKNRG
jgi:hypothetical protein